MSDKYQWGENLPRDLKLIEQDVKFTQIAIRETEAKDWGPLPPKTAEQRNIRALHARLVDQLEVHKAKLAKIKAELGR